MTMIYVALFLILSADYISAACDGNGNRFIDEVLANMKPDLAQHMQLADINDGDLHMSGITVWGFESLHRAGNFCFENLGNGKERITAELEVFNIHGAVAHGSIKERIKVGFIHVSHTFNFHLDVDLPHIKVLVSIDFDVNARHLSLYNFAFEAFDNAKFHIHVNGILHLLDHIFNHLADHYGNKLKPKVETMIRNSVATRLSSFQSFDLIPH